MEEKTVKSIALILVVLVGAYAIYDLFKNSSFAMSLGAPGHTTGNLAGIPGVPQYVYAPPAASTPQAIASVASQVLAQYGPAFGSSGNPDMANETDYTELDYSNLN